MMTPEQQTRIDEITSRCSFEDKSVHTLEERAQLIQDILWLIQLAEVKDTQIDMLSMPAGLSRVIRDFSRMTKARQELFVQLIGELKGDRGAQNQT